MRVIQASSEDGKSIRDGKSQSIILTISQMADREEVRFQLRVPEVNGVYRCTIYTPYFSLCTSVELGTSLLIPCRSMQLL